MKLEENKEYLHVDGTIHLVNHIEGGAAFVQILSGGNAIGQYSTSIIDGKMEDYELAGSLAPYTRP